ncbi:hypothetical protein FOVSG1_011951 [Fusarium oxysporum f. sp. vasinfectum]
MMDDNIDPEVLMSFGVPWPDENQSNAADHSEPGSNGVDPGQVQSSTISSAATSSLYTKPFSQDSPGKTDGRFSSSTIKILRSWFDNHFDHPYPTADDVQHIIVQTGLNKQQIRDWFANSRRRASSRSRPKNRSQEVSASSAPSPQAGPRRRPTPAPLLTHMPPASQHLNPLQRWERSPTDEEAASLSDISRALCSLPEPSYSPHVLESLERPRASSSIAASQSSDSCSSAHSRTSHFSYSSQGKARRAASNRQRLGRGMPRPIRDDMFQCTFCPRRFQSKHEWQRHEKSVHLPFVQWVCSPFGPTIAGPEEQSRCAYCGVADLDDTHLHRHNHSVCLERPLHNKTFYRKDHLVQHLHVVHHVLYSEELMQSWVLIGPEIRSRCGFCDAWFDSWTDRVDHLANHFRHGKTMADWKGNWGFEDTVVCMVENAMPPYLVSYEQKTALPFPAAGRTMRFELNAYHIIKEELNLFVQKYYHSKEEFPPDDELRRAGLATLETAERVLRAHPHGISSWLRDIFVTTGTEYSKRPYDPQDWELPVPSQNWENGASLFENCSLEDQLRRFVRMHSSLGRSCRDDVIQEEACLILKKAESTSFYTSRHLLSFMTRLIWASTAWITPLRERVSMDLVGLMDSHVHSNVRMTRTEECCANLNDQRMVHQGSAEPNFRSGYPTTDHLSTSSGSCQSRNPELPTLSTPVFVDYPFPDILPSLPFEPLPSSLPDLDSQQPTTRSQDTGTGWDTSIQCAPYPDIYPDITQDSRDDIRIGKSGLSEQKEQAEADLQDALARPQCLHLQ